MRACNWGDTLTRRVHENAAKRTAAMRARAQVFERPELFIASQLVTMAAFTQAIFRGSRAGCGGLAEMNFVTPVRKIFSAAKLIVPRLAVPHFAAETIKQNSD
jgi:hypothetical protein